MPCFYVHGHQVGETNPSIHDDLREGAHEKALRPGWESQIENAYSVIR